MQLYPVYLHLPLYPFAQCVILFTPHLFVHHTCCYTLYPFTCIYSVSFCLTCIHLATLNASFCFHCIHLFTLQLLFKPYSSHCICYDTLSCLQCTKTHNVFVCLHCFHFLHLISISFVCSVCISVNWMYHILICLQCIIPQFTLLDSFVCSVSIYLLHLFTLHVIVYTVSFIGCAVTLLVSKPDSGS